MLCDQFGRHQFVICHREKWVFPKPIPCLLTCRKSKQDSGQVRQTDCPYDGATRADVIESDEEEGRFEESSSSALSRAESGEALTVAGSTAASVPG